MIPNKYITRSIAAGSLLCFFLLRSRLFHLLSCHVDLPQTQSTFTIGLDSELKIIMPYNSYLELRMDLNKSIWVRGMHSYGFLVDNIEYR